MSEPPAVLPFVSVARLGGWAPFEVALEEKLRTWRFGRSRVPPLRLRAPDELRDAGLNVDAVEELGERILGAADEVVRHTDRGATAPICRSPERAAFVAVALGTVEGYFADLLAALRSGGPAAARELIGEILLANGYKLVEDWRWGGTSLVPVDAPPDYEFPGWLVKEEIARLAKIFEHTIGRRLTEVERDTVVRDAAEERLRRKQNALGWKEGQTLSQHEGEKRSDRRRASRERHRRTHVRYAPGFRDRLLAAISTNPDAGTKELARLVRARPKTVSEELRIMEKQNVLSKVVVGQKHRWAPVRPVPEGVPPDSTTRVIDSPPGPRLRVAAPAEDVGEVEETATGLLARRAS